MEFNFEQLDVWKESVAFAAAVCKIAKIFPPDEIYGLTSQLRRAAVSVAANIAEGKGRYSKKDFRNFLYTARGSLYEVITHLRIARKLEYISQEEMESLNSQSMNILRKLSGLIKSLDVDLPSEPRAPSSERS